MNRHPLLGLFVTDGSQSESGLVASLSQWPLFSFACCPLFDLPSPYRIRRCPATNEEPHRRKRDKRGYLAKTSTSFPRETTAAHVNAERLHAPPVSDGGRICPGKCLLVIQLSTVRRREMQGHALHVPARSLQPASAFLAAWPVLANTPTEEQTHFHFSPSITPTLLPTPLLVRDSPLAPVIENLAHLALRQLQGS